MNNMNNRKNIEVVAAIFRKENTIFATEKGYGEFKGYWEFPGGKVEPGESLEEALRREIREELQVEIHIEEKFTELDYDYPHFHLTMHCYFCSVLSGEITLVEAPDARWLKKEELNTVNWLPADISLIEELKKQL